MRLIVRAVSFKYSRIIDEIARRDAVRAERLMLEHLGHREVDFDANFGN